MGNGLLDNPYDKNYKAPVKHAGTLYVLQEEGDGPVKIGWVNAWMPVEWRMSTLQTGNPRALRIVRVFPGMPKRIERLLHRRLRQWRIRGEWFDRGTLAVVDDLVLPTRPERWREGAGHNAWAWIGEASAEVRACLR